MKQASIPDVGYMEHHKFPKWGKVSKICMSRMFPAPSTVKEQFAGHVSEYLCKGLDWFYRFEDFTFHFTSFFCSNVNTINKSMILHNIHVNFFASRRLASFLFITHPCFFFIFHQVVWKPFKFINNVLQTNESLVNKSNFPSFLSLCLFILGHRLRKCLNNINIH